MIEDKTDEVRTDLTYGGSKFPKWLALVWIIFLIWMVAYLVTFWVPNFTIWLKDKPVDRFVQ